MAEITHRTIQTNGINMHIAEAGEGPLVVMVHGFPELWYSYRHQLPALADAGYHAVACDVRGYGGTDAPYEIEAYAMRQHVADTVGILDALGEDTAVVVGHDWGAPIAWNTAFLHPDRFRAVVGLSVPFLARPAAPPLDILGMVFKDTFFYMLYFQEPGIAEEEFESDVRRSMLLFMWAASGEAPPMPQFAGKPKDSKLFDGIDAPEKMPSWLSDEDLDIYVAEFKRTGFRGPLNRYRNLNNDWHDLPQLAGAKIQQPALFVAGENDGVIKMTSPDGMKETVPNLRKSVILPGCGHWTQQERPNEVNAELIAFLDSL
jgi:pimeloyl-ACP methyl ester carboxylesterase